MNRPIRLLVLSLTAACFTQAAEFTPYDTTLAAAKQAGADFIVFYEGPSWLPETARVSRSLTDPATRKMLPGIAGWAAVPAVDLAADDAKKLKAKPDFIPYDLPALALVDATGKTFAVAEGVTPANLPQALRALANAVPMRERRDALLAKAESAKRAARARLLGQALDQLPLTLSNRNKEIIAEINKADPDDATGYGFKYTFHAGSFHERTTLAMIREKKQRELVQLVEKHLANRVLHPHQRQALLSAKMQAQRSQDDITGAVVTLRKIIEIDPRSQLGLGAAEYIRLLTEPVRLRGLTWETMDNRPIWLPMVADVSETMKEAGTYQIEFRHRDGHTRFRKVSLRSGGREITADPNKSESTKVMLTVPSRMKGRKLELWAESCGTGWFSGCGEIVVTQQ